MAIISCGARPIPRDRDITVQTSRAQVELATDLSIMVAVTQDDTLSHGTNRVQFFLSETAVQDVFPEGTEARAMAQAFFAQPVRARTLAIGRAVQSAVPAFLVGSNVGAEAAFTAVSAGSFTLTVDGDDQDISGLDFTGATTYADITTIIQAAVRAIGSGGFSLATVEITGGAVRITSGTTGDASRIAALAATGSGTDISGAGFLNAQADAATITDGYLPTTITNELSLIAAAAGCQGRYLYGWALDRRYRDHAELPDVAAWIQSRRAVMALTSNNVAAFNAGAQTDIGYLLTNGIQPSNVFLFWSDQVEQYVDVGLLAYMLHVNYGRTNSTVTAKFQRIENATPAGVTEAQLSVLRSKGYNVYANVGNTSRYVLDGQQVDPSWFLDSVINFDNFEEDMSTNVANFFLRMGKVAYRQSDILLYYDAQAEICQRYVRNGTLAERRVLDTTLKPGFRIDPAYTITIEGLETLTVSDRATRAAPPSTIDANEAGAIHSANILINAIL